MKEILQHLYAHGKLSFTEAKEVMLDITSERYNSYQVASFITAFNMRPITVEELDGFRISLLEKCIPIDLEDRKCLDIVGTGGDGKDTFNISTLSAVVLAGAGIMVAKHGSTSSSSVCGSSNVLEHLGYSFTSNQDKIYEQLDEHNLCFLHAPLFHPALKSVSMIRKSLKVKTFFNMLGPLVHPGQPSHNFFGVYKAPVGRLYQSLLSKQDRKFSVVYNLDGYDEISLTDSFILRDNNTSKTYSPEEIGLPTYKPEHLFGGADISSNAKVFMDVLLDEATPAQKDVVIANAAFSIQLYKNEIALPEAVHIAKESIESGKALNNFRKLLN
jgi:anthranilate phosphoribosyltransferase